MTDTRDSFEKIIAEMQEIYKESLWMYQLHHRIEKWADRLTALQSGAGDGKVLTYRNQPDNVGAWRIGEACSKAEPGGDWIDHGLSLLQKLQEKGYGVIAIPAIDNAQATEGK